MGQKYFLLIGTIQHFEISLFQCDNRHWCLDLLISVLFSIAPGVNKGHLDLVIPVFFASNTILRNLLSLKQVWTIYVFVGYTRWAWKSLVNLQFLAILIHFYLLPSIAQSLNIQVFLALPARDRILRGYCELFTKRKGFYRTRWNP